MFLTRKKVKKEIDDVQKLIQEEKDKEIIEMANEEMTRLLEEEKKITEEAHQISLPSNLLILTVQVICREDKKNCTIEVRAGAGGVEACLFTEDILNMYKSYCGRKDWRWSVLSCNVANGGGFHCRTSTYV